MTLKELRILYRSEPFHPFELHMADGRSVQVRHREFMALPQADTDHVILIFAEGGGFNVIDLNLVTSFRVRSDLPKAQVA